MENTDEKLEQLINSKKFNELTAIERDFVLIALGSEEEFSVLQGIEPLLLTQALRSKLDPDVNTLASLKIILKQRRSGQSAWQKFYHLQIPAYATAILLVGTSLLTIWLTSSKDDPGRPLATAPLVRHDTVYVVKTDTVFKEKLTRVINTSLPPEPGMEEVKPTGEPIARPVGASMKDKDELNKLLVSGSE